MKKSLQWFAGILIFVAIGCGAAWLFSPLLMFVAVICFPEIVDQENPAYFAEAKIDGYTFEVTLIRNHPLLAEYKKSLKIKQGERLVLERGFIDAGGMASFYFLRKGSKIIVLDGIRNGFVLDIPTAEISKVDLDAVPKEFPEESFGRFMFVYEQEQIYRWVAKEDLPKEAK